MLAKYSGFGLADKPWMKRMHYNCIPQLGNHSRTKQTLVTACGTNTNVFQ